MTKEECEIETSKAIMEMRTNIAKLEKENAELKERLDDKDMAETDLATVAYMQGAERYKTKWHRLSAGDTPKENKLYLVKIKDNGLAIAYFNGQHWETRYNLGDYGHCVETVIAWCEIPKFEE